MNRPEYLSAFLYRVVSCRPWQGRALRGEDALAYEVATFLRAETIEGKLLAIWCHVPNEGLASRAMAALVRCLGLMPGWPDLVFLWRGGCLLIELKVGRNGLSEAQKGVREWAAIREVPFLICRSLDEVKEALREHGVWKGGAA